MTIINIYGLLGPPSPVIGCHFRDAIKNQLELTSNYQAPPSWEVSAPGHTSLRTSQSPVKGKKPRGQLSGLQKPVRQLSHKFL